MDILQEYLDAYLKPESFSTVLADRAQYTNPVFSCEGRAEAAEALQAQAHQCKELDIQKIFRKDNEVCAVYDLVSSVSSEERIRIVDLLTIEDGKIQSIDQTFDATKVNRRNCEI